MEQMLVMHTRTKQQFGLVNYHGQLTDEAPRSVLWRFKFEETWPADRRPAVPCIPVVDMTETFWDGDLLDWLPRHTGRRLILQKLPLNDLSTCPREYALALLLPLDTVEYIQTGIHLCLLRQSSWTT